jgi:hypothetical protein
MCLATFNFFLLFTEVTSLIIKRRRRAGTRRHAKVSTDRIEGMIQNYCQQQN